MDIQLTTIEINEKRKLLQDYSPAQEALTILENNKGRFDTSFDKLWENKNGVHTFGERKSLWQVTLKELRNELCGNEGFRAQFQEYTKNPGSTPLLTGLIVSLTTLAGLPIDPAIATIIVLYLLKIGLNIFCSYTEPVGNSDSSSAKEGKVG